ncbi:MAG: hypothetical protein J6M06_02680 [Synergistaceae bacterium]|nr:hypothetical protein [Synergistaceae bacterium]
MRKIIAIDFDGCLVESQWPEIGAAREEVFAAAKREQHDGAALILWTCRTDRYLDAAVEFCRKRGLLFDAVNENLPEVIEAYGGSDCRKVVADEYWDDHAVLTPAGNMMNVEDVARIIGEQFGDCPCDYSPIDEWLPQVCQYTANNACPDPADRFGCWKEFFKHYRTKED